MTTLRVTIRGNPIPQGSKSIAARGAGMPRMYDANPNLKAWRTTMRTTIQTAIVDTAWEPLKDTPIRATLTFTLAPPKLEARRILRHPGHHYAWRGYDLDKLTRAALDSLTDAGAWDDDSRVASLMVRKLWVGGAYAMTEPGLTIEVRPVTP